MSALYAHQGNNTYQKVNKYGKIEGASPHQLVQMLMQGAIDNLASAKGSMERRDFDNKAKSLSKVIAIVTELKENLDIDKGAEIAENLNNIYDYILRLILSASMENKPELLVESAELMINLLGAWNTIPEELHGIKN